MKYDITTIYCMLDDFCKTYQEWQRKKLIDTNRTRIREGKLSLSEALTIMACFHSDGFKNFKYYYTYGVSVRDRKCFRELPCYERFVQLMPSLFIPLSVILHFISGEESGVYFIDSTKLPVCHNKRISQNRVFKGMAKIGKSSMGWFYGFKLHIIVNHKGQIMAVKITKGNVDDRTNLESMSQGLYGSLVGDKGYISRQKFEALYNRGLKLIVGIKRNMKNILMPYMDKVMLRKRSIIETIFEILKHDMNIDHTRHRSPVNAFVNIMSAICSYALRKNKPQISMRTLQLIHN
jgi:hypothetical protein